MTYVQFFLAMTVAGSALAGGTQREQELTETLFQMLPAGTYSDRTLATEGVRLTKAEKEAAKHACIIKVSYGDGKSTNMKEAYWTKISAKYRGAVGEFRITPSGDGKVIEFPKKDAQDFSVAVDYPKGALQGKSYRLHARRLPGDKWEIDVLNPQGQLTPKMCGPLHRIFDMNPDGPAAAAEELPHGLKQQMCSGAESGEWMNACGTGAQK